MAIGSKTEKHEHRKVTKQANQTSDAPFQFLEPSRARRGEGILESLLSLGKKALKLRDLLGLDELLLEVLDLVQGDGDLE